MTYLMAFATRLWHDEEGATAVEYGLLAVLISVLIIAAVTTLGGQLFDTFNEVNTSLGGTAVVQP